MKDKITHVSPLLEEVNDAHKYDKWNGQHKKILFLITFTAFVGPLSSTLLYPSLPSIISEFKTDEFWGTLTVSVYFLVSGSMPLFWGPLSDRYGRKKMIIIGLVVFSGMGFGSMFSWDIISLIVFRVVQAIGTGSLMVIGNGVISDIYRPAVRGDALGWFTLGPSVGPLFGPILGGLISELLGWRWVFGTISIASTLQLVLVIFVLPETLNPDIPRASLNFLRPLRFLFHPAICTLCFVNALDIAIVSATLVLFPLAMENKFHLSQIYTGLSYLPYGILALLGSKVGGKLSDVMPQYFGLGGRLVPTLGGVLLSIMGAVLYGVAEEYWVILFATSLLGFGFCCQRPGVYSFAIQMQPNYSSAVSATLLFVHYMLAFVATTVSPLFIPIEHGDWWFFFGSSLLLFLITIPLVILMKMRWNHFEDQKK